MATEPTNPTSPITDMAVLAAMLHAAVAAKLAYWDRLAALEKAVAPEGEFSDRANDEVVDLIDLIAAGADDVVVIEPEHVADLIRLANLD